MIGLGLMRIVLLRVQFSLYSGFLLRGERLLVLRKMLYGVLLLLRIEATVLLIGLSRVIVLHLLRMLVVPLELSE